MGLLGRYRGWFRNRDEYMRYRRAYRAWRAANPASPFADFYVQESIDRIDESPSSYLPGLGERPDWGERRADGILARLRAAGLAPHHLCVDYGCGSLWVGEAVMSYLQPDRYIGLDLIDRFYTAALARLPPDLVETRRPVFHVISERSLDEVKARAPDFVFSTGVFLHVPPAEMDNFFARLTSIAAPGSRIFVGHKTGLYSCQRNPRVWRHGRRAIIASLAKLGYSARFPKTGGKSESQMFQILPRGQDA